MAMLGDASYGTKVLQLASDTRQADGYPREAADPDTHNEWRELYQRRRVSCPRHS
jgi:hypothetical protein